MSAYGCLCILQGYAQNMCGSPNPNNGLVLDAWLLSEPAHYHHTQHADTLHGHSQSGTQGFAGRAEQTRRAHGYSKLVTDTTAPSLRVHRGAYAGHS